MTFKLDHGGAAEVLKQQAAGVIAAVTNQVAANAGEVAWANTYTTDRAAGSVTVPAGMQAKHGVLTKAAAAAGLEVRAGDGIGTASVASRRGKRWEAHEIRGIFQGSAADVARRTGRSVAAVRAQRQSIMRMR